MILKIVIFVSEINKEYVVPANSKDNKYSFTGFRYYPKLTYCRNNENGKSINYDSFKLPNSNYDCFLNEP
jgi:hypothetical protein